MIERVECPANRDHRPRMIHERRYGVATGRMIAWCYSCGREVLPGELPPLSITDEERARYVRDQRERPRNAVRRKREQVGWWTKATPEQIERDTAIRLAWARGVTQLTLSLRYELSQARISQIVSGSRRRYA